MNEPQEITATELRRVPIWRSFVVRSIGLLVLLTIGMVCLTAFWIHEEQKREVVDKFGLALESTAATAAPFISAGDVVAIQQQDDFGSASFARVRETLEIIRLENHLENEQIYILRRDPGDHHLTFVAMLQDETFIGHRYNPPDEIVRYYNWVFETADAIRTDLYTDVHGTYISGIAPIVDERGEVVAVLQVDYPVDLYLAEVDRQSNILLAGGGTLIVVIALLGLFIQFQLRRKIGQLLAGTHAISREDYDYRIPLAGGDELRVLADALNQTMGRLKERFEMLKFLPSHTAKMIETKSREGGGVRIEEGRLVEVAVLESDIRGFTKLSSTLTPVEVIAMLNLYIRVQADIIVAAGGSVDKFMGDAVLAVFEGPERSKKALGAALAIQAAVADMNERGVFARPIGIGIGLSEGEVVMGNMGSDQRMEYTVIGSVVNLAARLCTAAHAGEVVAQSTVVDHGDGVADDLVWQPDEIIAKGFADPVACIRIGVTAPGPTSSESSTENRTDSAG